MDDHMVMDEYDEESLLNHIRGATVRHSSPFAEIPIPGEQQAISQAYIDKWVAPFYRVSFQSSDYIPKLKDIYNDITTDVIKKLLLDTNWRARIVGGFFAGLKRSLSVEKIIGPLLLQSEVCFAGRMYCVALAEFNTDTGLIYLCKYLNYYLTRPDLEFDQGFAMAAVVYIDQMSGSNVVSKYRPLWDDFVSALAYPPILNEAIEEFNDELNNIQLVRNQMSDGV